MKWLEEIEEREKKATEHNNSPNYSEEYFLVDDVISHEQLTKLLELARRAVEMAEFYATANYSGDISQESTQEAMRRIYNDTGYKAREFLDWVAAQEEKAEDIIKV